MFYLPHIFQVKLLVRQNSGKYSFSPPLFLEFKGLRNGLGIEADHLIELRSVVDLKMSKLSELWY